MLVFILTLHRAVTEAQQLYLSITTHKVGKKKEVSSAKAHQQVLTTPPQLCRKRRADFRAWCCIREQFGLKSGRLAMDHYQNLYLIKVSIHSSVSFSRITKFWMNKTKVSTQSAVCHTHKSMNISNVCTLQELFRIPEKSTMKNGICAMCLYWQCLV